MKAATSTDANIRGASAPPATEPPPSTQPSGELQVSHVEVLGPSDAQVNIGDVVVGDQRLTLCTDIPHTEQVPDTRKFAQYSTSAPSHAAEFDNAAIKV